MKVGVRKPSIEKSIKARTSGKMKRKFKRMVNPLYGKKGMGWIRDPKRALYNKVYRKTTISSKKAMGLVGACIYYPIYWTLMLMYWIVVGYFYLMWLLIKAMVWMVVSLVNGIIYLVECFVNRNATEALVENTGESFVEVAVEENKAESK